MSSYVKRKNCCLLKKSKKYFEAIRQNANEIMDVINELTIKGEFCELKEGDITRLYSMRNVIGEVIKGWDIHTHSKLNEEVTFLGGRGTYTDSSGNIQIAYPNEDHTSWTTDEAGNTSLDVTNFPVTLGPHVIDFEVQLYMVGDKLQAKSIPMYKLSDVVGAAFVTAESKDEFESEYLHNPDILIEDISEFLQGIDKLEDLMKQLSLDNTRDSDTEFCCEGKPPERGPSCN